MVKQQDLPFRRKNQDIPDEVILNQNTFRDALRLCVETSGLNYQQVSNALGRDPADISRMLSMNGTGRHFPPELVGPLMEACGNIIPLRWLALRCGYELRPLRTALERENQELRSKLEEKEREIEVIKQFLRDIA